jgi:hypothetical protein
METWRALFSLYFFPLLNAGKIAIGPRFHSLLQPPLTRTILPLNPSSPPPPVHRHGRPPPSPPRGLQRLTDPPSPRPLPRLQGTCGSSPRPYPLPSPSHRSLISCVLLSRRRRSLGGTRWARRRRETQRPSWGARGRTSGSCSRQPPAIPSWYGSSFSSCRGSLRLEQTSDCTVGSCLFI